MFTSTLKYTVLYPCTTDKIVSRNLPITNVTTSLPMQTYAYAQISERVQKLK